MKFFPVGLCQYFDHKKVKLFDITKITQLLRGYKKRNARWCTASSPASHANPFWGIHFKRLLIMYSFSDSEVSDASSLISSLCLFLCLGSNPCWNGALTNYPECLRCVLWRHEQWGGSGGEWRAALQGRLSVHWPQQFPPWGSPGGTSWSPHRLVSTTHKWWCGFYSSTLVAAMSRSIMCWVFCLSIDMNTIVNNCFERFATDVTYYTLELEIWIHLYSYTWMFNKVQILKIN